MRTIIVKVPQCYVDHCTLPGLIFQNDSWYCHGHSIHDCKNKDCQFQALQQKVALLNFADE